MTMIKKLTSYFLIFKLLVSLSNAQAMELPLQFIKKQQKIEITSFDDLSSSRSVEFTSIEVIDSHNQAIGNIRWPILPTYFNLDIYLKLNNDSLTPEQTKDFFTTCLAYILKNYALKSAQLRIGIPFDCFALLDANAKILEPMGFSLPSGSHNVGYRPCTIPYPCNKAFVKETSDCLKTLIFRADYI